MDARSSTRAASTWRSSCSRSSPASASWRGRGSRPGFPALSHSLSSPSALLFAAVGLWQAHTRTIFFARDLEVANAYTTWFRVTSLFKDPSLYGRYLVVPIAILLVILLFRRGRTYDWVVIAALVAFLFAGLYFSYSQSSFVALFVVTFALAALATGRQLRIVLVCCAIGGRACCRWLCRRGHPGELREGGDERPLATRRDHARRLQDQPRDRRRSRRPAARERGRERPTDIAPKRLAHDAAHRAGRARDRRLRPLRLAPRRSWHGLSCSSRVVAAFSGWASLRCFSCVFVHSLLYAGFFEDPLVWGVLGLSAAVLSWSPGPTASIPRATPEPLPRQAH